MAPRSRQEQLGGDAGVQHRSVHIRRHDENGARRLLPQLRRMLQQGGRLGLPWIDKCDGGRATVPGARRRGGTSTLSRSLYRNSFIYSFIFAIFIQTCHVLICGRCGRTSSLTSTTRHTQTTQIAGLAVTTSAATRTGSHGLGATR